MKISKAIQKVRNELSRSRAGYPFIYTLVFVVACVISFLPFVKNGVDFVWTGGGAAADGYTQHYTALMYLGQWGREIIRTLISEHKLIIPMWDFSIGYGSDIVTTMHYYAFGDPLNLLSIITPSRFSELLYNALVILRLYLAGLSFSLFCFKMNKNKVATMAGSFVYILCGYSLFALVRHPFFVNPMIYLPLVLIGAEKILRKEKPFLFIFMVFISTISNFYFLYMIVLTLVLYVMLRYFTDRKREKSLKDFSVKLGRFALGGLLGIAMGAAIFIPVVNVFLSSARVSETGGYFEILYTTDYYKRLLASAFSSANPPLWTCLGFSAPAFVAITVMFTNRKRHKGMKIALCFLVVMLLFPIFGKIFNGFSYVSNRWTFVLAGLVAFIVVSVWDEMLKITKKKLLFVSGCSFAYYIILLIVSKAVTESTYVSMCLILITLLFLFLNGNGSFKKIPQIIVSVGLATLIIFGGCINAYYKYNPEQQNYVSEFMSINTGVKGIDNSSDKVAAKVMKGKGFCRNEQTKTTNLNASVITGSKGVQYYWSLENGYVSDFLLENGVSPFMAQKYDGLNSRAYLDALASVKYYIKTDGSRIPYGFKAHKEVCTKDGSVYETYKNRNSLPLGYTYSSYTDKKDYQKMSPAEKQQAMLQSVVLENADENKALSEYSEGNPEFTHIEKEPAIVAENNVVQNEDGSFLVNKKKASISLYFDSTPKCENYLYIKGVEVEKKTKFELYMDDCQEYLSEEEYESLSKMEKNQLDKVNNNVEKTDEEKLKFVVKAKKSKVSFTHYSEDYKYSTGQKDYFINMGYSKKGIQKITLHFPITGVYRFEDIQVVSQPMENLKHQVKKLKKDVLENVKTGTNSVKGHIKLEEDKILCLSIPYSKGWRAIVDGKETELMTANTMYMAIPLEKGAHKIELRYKTPLLKESVFISIGAFMVFALLLLISLFRGRKRKKSI